MLGHIICNHEDLPSPIYILYSYFIHCSEADQGIGANAHVTEYIMVAISEREI